jgi:hypothetical protein
MVQGWNPGADNYSSEYTAVCVMFVLLMTAGFASRLKKDPPQSISPEFS